MAKILIVDDNSTNRKLLKNVLAGSGESYELFEADNGESALEIVEFEMPDVILLDVMMPKMNGYEVCKKLSSDDKTKSIPILFISAMEATADKVKAFKVGGADYITKPINPEEVKARVAAHLRIRKAEMERTEAEGMKTLKAMIATYNHNMNQPLMAAYMFLDVFTAKGDESEKSVQLIGKIKRELDKVKVILEKIQKLDEAKQTDYVGGIGMIDLDAKVEKKA